MSFHNTSLYIIPVSVGDAIKMTDELLLSGSWEWDHTLGVPNYLLHYVHGLATDRERFRVLSYREPSSLPISVAGGKRRYSSRPSIDAIYLCAFGTGVAFLEFRVSYGDMTVDEIIDFAYHFKKADAADQRGLLKEGEISLMTAARRLLMVERTNAELFFSYRNSFQSNCICYHMIHLSGEQAEREDVDRLCFYLKRSYDSAYLYDKSNDGSEYDMIYKPYSYMTWAGCQEGLVHIASDTDNEKTNRFLNGYHFTNLMRDYHFTYLLLLNQRFTSLKYIDALASITDDTEEVERISAASAILKTRYSFRVVSDEMVYQNIYSDMYRIFHIDKLLLDVADCGSRMEGVEAAESKHHEKTTSSLLLALSVLALFSALVDASGYFDRMFPHMNIATIVGTGSVIGVFLLVLGKTVVDFFRSRRQRKRHK